MPTSAGLDVANIDNLSVGTILRLTNYIDDSGTVGSRTVNRQRGKNAFAIGAAAVTITNSLVTADSQILVTLEVRRRHSDDHPEGHPGAGSFVVTGNANATAATKFSWCVIN